MVIGQTITGNNTRLTLIGVSQAGFDGVDIGYVPSLRIPILMKAQIPPNWDDVDNMGYTVVRRTREIGVRMAPGAVPANVIWLVMREVVVLVGSGLGLGLVASWGLSRYVSSQLYGITGGDPLTMAGACVLLASVAALAGYIPARRATRVNPVLALRYE